MRIALLSVSAEVGGSERVLVDLVRGLVADRTGWEPVVVLPRDGRLAAAVRDAGGDVSVLAMPDALAAFGESSSAGVAAKCARAVAAASAAHAYSRQLAGRLARLAPDVVHSNGFKFHVLAARAAPGVPLVWHMHEYLHGRRLSRVLLRRHVARVSAIVANSRSVAADVQHGLESPLPVQTVYNGVDLDDFSPAGPVADLDALSGLTAAPPGTVRIGLVATYGRWKGHETFMRALRTLGGAWRAYIVGGPMYDTQGSQYSRAELEACARDAGIGDRMGFTGWIDTPSAAMRALDVVVHASTRPEPFGLVIVQGMGCGKAVIVSAEGGAAELVTDGHDALTHRPGDVDGLSRALARCVDDAALRARLGREARRTAEATFDARGTARAFASIYEGLVRRPVAS